MKNIYGMVFFLNFYLSSPILISNKPLVYKEYIQHE